MYSRVEAINELLKAKETLSYAQRMKIKNLEKRDRDTSIRIKTHKGKAPVLKVRCK